MKNKKETLLILTILITICIIIFNRDKLYEAKYIEPKDTLLAITINGEISTTFPTTNAYTGTVECTTGTGKVEWNGTKWILTTSGITKGSTKCNAIFKQTLRQSILANNEVKTPLTTPGKEVSAHTKDDVESQTTSVSSTYQAYYFTYGTGYTANGSKFNLTGTAVTSDTYANSYSSLVGKYFVSSSASSNGSSTAGTMKTTTNLSSVYYVVSATSSSYTYKRITSNKNTTEALLASTEDDYGTSYYFRGAVKNNYVEFANKCWRIVRITGDGAVKLVLHNDNTTKAANPCSAANNSTTAAFARYSGSTYNTLFNTNYDDNTYIGFMYGTAGSSDYASTHANTNKSTILTNLETWYTNNLASYESKLADTIWCNDKSTRSGDLGYGTNVTYYGANNRLASTNQPTLKCPNDNNGGKLSKFTVDDTKYGNGALKGYAKIGMLTADEIAFAGGVYGKDNINYYLNKNASAEFWWTISPSNYWGYARVWYVAKNGNLAYDGYVHSNNIAVRPSITLSSKVKWSEGVGTASSPYRIS